MHQLLGVQRHSPLLNNKQIRDTIPENCQTLIRWPDIYANDAQTVLRQVQNEIIERTER
jgi:hypothetical protein